MTCHHLNHSFLPCRTIACNKCWNCRDCDYKSRCADPATEQDLVEFGEQLGEEYFKKLTQHIPKI